jgi:hypothetical protein
VRFRKDDLESIRKACPRALRPSDGTFRRKRRNPDGNL